MSAPTNAFDLAAKSQIAQLQRGLGPPVWVAACALLVWGIWSALAWAIALGMALALLTPFIIGTQCLWMSASNRSDAAASLAKSVDLAQAPVLNWSGTLKVWAQETLTAWRVFGLWQPWGWRSEPNVLPQPGAAAQRGVIFVHGFFCNRGLWRRHLRRLQDQGVPCIAVNLEPAFGGINSYPAILEQAVSAMLLTTGMPPVILAHSMGGLATRAWLCTTQPNRVHRVITLGTPHHGTDIAAWAHTRNGRQMRFMSRWIQTLAAKEANRPSALNKFLCVLSDGDNIVFPCATAALPGAAHHFIAACGHVALVDHPDTYRLLDQALAAPAQNSQPTQNTSCQK